MMSNPAFTSSHFVIIGLQIIFAIAHSGGAAVRPWAEKYIGPRLYRIIFALISLPLAVILIVYFFNHLIHSINTKCCAKRSSSVVNHFFDCRTRLIQYNTNSL